VATSKRILVVGPSGAGKDTACRLLAELTTLRFASTTSDRLARHVAARLGVSVEQAYRSRHANRNLWHRIGNDIRKHDPGQLVRESLEDGEITAGARGIEEVRACRRDYLVDLIVWIDNPRVSGDSTLTFTERDCDEVVPNRGSLEELREQLLLLARRAGLPLRD
jgi:cytidylate kinase